MGKNDRDDATVPTRRLWTKRLLCPTFFIILLFLSGCEKISDLDQAGAHQSLVEIGERSLELAELKENDNQIAEANASFRRALWAFEYHEHLTGEEPLLMEEARDGVERTTPKSAFQKRPARRNKD